MHSRVMSNHVGNYVPVLLLAVDVGSHPQQLMVVSSVDSC